MIRISNVDIYGLISEMKTIAIIDYRMGNLFSVFQACENTGLRAIITSDRKEIDAADGVILPGVGSYSIAMSNLRDLGLVDLIKSVISDEKPFMGICLGFQLLFQESEEFEISKGIGVFEGSVKKFNFSQGDTRVKVPHTGWNQILSVDNNNWHNSMLSGINIGEFMYFVHSYYVECKEENIRLTMTNYEGFDFCSSIEKKNVFAAQFHPEKSAEMGKIIYSNFANSIMRK
jgi:imidazole glycerol-phosphate synthase subunit HisH